MKKEIIPAILEKSFSKIEKKIKEVEGLVDFVQVDICDGKFVPSKTFASASCKTSFLKLKNITKKIALELDMMVDLDTKIKGRFEKWLRGIERANPKRVVFHFGSTQRWDDVFQFLKKSKILKKVEVGLAVQIQHKEKDFLKIFEKYDFDYIQFMGIEKIGYGGQELTAKVYRKIKSFKKKFPKVPVQVDGGVKKWNAKKLLEAGNDRFVSGSGIYKSEDIKKTISEFLS